ncbi:MAG TPA: transposase, partial [Firmicutes bacterium]|nr:transposase [Bacillota bacterium]
MRGKSGKITFKPYIQNQPMLLPPSLDELVPKGHLVRVVNDAVERMNIAPLLERYKGGGTSSYHPKMMLKVLVYAYSQRIYSSRLIAKALRENIHFMWLSGQNQPDFRTINRFRSSTMKGLIEQVFASVLELLLDAGYVKLENYFLDGTKVEANANRYSFVWAKSIAHNKAKLQDKIKLLLEQIEKANEEENAEYGDR